MDVIYVELNILLYVSISILGVRAFECMLLRRMFGPKTKEIKGR
jgi:hypothetical protein